MISALFCFACTYLDFQVLQRILRFREVANIQNIVTLAFLLFHFYFHFWCLFISEILGGCKDLKYRQPSKPLTSPCVQGCCWNIFLLCHCFFSWKCSLSWRQGQDIWNQQKHLIIFCLIMYHSNSLSPIMLWSLIFYNNLITHPVLICLLMPRLVSAC